MELRKAYADIVARAWDQWIATGTSGYDAYNKLALACQELADRPPRELTDAEIDAAYENLGFCGPIHVAVRAAIAAAHAKQREPQVVKFRAAMNKESGAIEMLRDGNSLPTAWCFLEPAQEFEVRI